MAKHIVNRDEIKKGDVIVIAHPGNQYVTVEREEPDYPIGTVVKYRNVAHTRYVRVGKDVWMYEDRNLPQNYGKANITDEDVHGAIAKGQAEVVTP